MLNRFWSSCSESFFHSSNSASRGFRILLTLSLRSSLSTSLTDFATMNASLSVVNWRFP